MSTTYPGAALLANPACLRRESLTQTIERYICLFKMTLSRRQLPLTFRKHGGARSGAGRKPKGARPGTPHRARPACSHRHPVHITLRVASAVGCLRRRQAYGVITRCLGASNTAGAIHIVHYSVMSNHLHLLVETSDRVALARGVQGLSIRMARALNRLRGRRGRAFADRYHARVLRTPREVRHALAYVLNNARRHRIVGRGASPMWLDPYSSASVFDGWRKKGLVGPPTAPVVAARSWLMRRGWRRDGLLEPAYVPG